MATNIYKSLNNIVTNLNNLKLALGKYMPSSNVNAKTLTDDEENKINNVFWIDGGGGWNVIGLSTIEIINTDYDYFIDHIEVIPKGWSVKIGPMDNTLTPEKIDDIKIQQRLKWLDYLDVGTNDD